MDLVIFGVQGSGKGTQARKLAAEFDYDIFETGAELRRIAASGTETGNTVKSFIDRGHLAPITIVAAAVRTAVSARPWEQRILFDGIPRDEEQMRAFDAMMADVGRTFRCINIVLGEEEAMARILGRARIEGRTDDADEAPIRRRMAIFREKTVPVIDAYRRSGLLTDVDGKGAVEEVYERMRRAVASSLPIIQPHLDAERSTPRRDHGREA